MKDCRKTVQDAAGGRLTPAEAEAILARVAGMGERLKAEGRTLALDRELMRLAKSEADDLRRKAAVAKRRAAIAALKHAEAKADLDRYRGEGLTAVVALKALMHGAERPVQGVRRSVWAYGQAYADRYLGGIMSAIAKERPHLERLLGDEAFNERVTREMEEIGKKNGKPGITGDDDARWLAQLYARYGEISRRDENRLGADVPARAGWTPHVHDPWRILKAGEAAWIRDTLPLLDLDKTFPGRDIEEIRDALANVWRTIATGRDAEELPALSGEGSPIAPANLAASLHQVRNLHFKPGAWQSYNRLYGYGTVTAAMVRHLRRAARVNGAMEVFGPNPAHMVKRLADELAHDVRRDPELPAARQNSEIETLNRAERWAATRVMTGEADAIGNATGAAVGEGIRSWEVLSKLGGVLLSSLTDPVTLANNLRFQGKPFLDAYAQVFKGYLKGRGEGEQRRLAFLLGEGFDGLIDNLVSPYAANDGPTGVLSRLTTLFFRLQGLTRFTDAGRAAGVRIMAADMGHHAARAWDALPARYRHVLTLQGLDAPRWEVLRAAAWQDEAGTAYLTPDRVAELPLESMDPIIADELEALQALGELPEDRLPALPAAVDPDFRVEGPARAAWGEGFPNVVVQRYGKVSELRAHPDYAAAKKGDAEAATRVVRDMLRDRALERIRQALGDRKPVPPHGAGSVGTPPVVVAVKPADPEGRNALPQAYAAALGQRLGLTVDAGIVQTNRTGHTDSAANHRIVRRALFDGPVEPGRDYLIVDDHVTLGSTLADLKAYIEAKGGRVVLAGTLTASPMSHRLAPDAGRLDRLRAKLGAAEPWFKERFGYGFEGLTRSEAWHLLRFDSAEALQKGLARAHADPLGRTSAEPADPVDQARKLEQTVTRLRQRARLRLELDLRRFFADEIAYGVIERDDRVKKAVTLGLERGTLAGEAWRILTQFKAFPIAFQQRVLGRRILAGPHRVGAAGAAQPWAGPRNAAVTLLGGSLHIGELVGTLWVAGLFATWAKDLARGQSPKSLVAADGGLRWKTLAAAMVQSGGLGIMGDFLFSEANRFGRSAAETLAGPGFGELVGLADLLMQLKSGEPRATRLLNQALGATPFINLFYTRAALDFLVLNSLREGVSPGFLRRQERRLRDEYGQQRLLPATVLSHWRERQWAPTAF